MSTGVDGGVPMRRRLGPALAALALGGVAVACGGGTASSATGQTQALSLGVVTSLTGSLATYGAADQAGADQAVAEVNGRGGILVGSTRYKLELDTLDDQGKADVAAANAKQLVSSGVKLFIGTGGSAITDAVAPAIGTQPVIFLDAGGSTPTAAQGRSNVFVLTPFSHVGLADAAAWYFAVHQTGFTKAAVISDQTTNALGQTFTDEFTRAWKGYGREITTVQYTTGATQSNFFPQLQAIKDTSPDLVVSAQTAQPNALTVKQMRSLGMSMPSISTAGGAAQEAQIAGAAINGTYETVGLSLETLASQGKSYVKGMQDAYQQRAGKPLVDLVGGYSSFYVAVYAAAAAMTAAGSTTDLNRIKAELHKIKISQLPQVTADKFSPVGQGLLFGSGYLSQPKAVIEQWQNNQPQFVVIYPGKLK